MHNTYMQTNIARENFTANAFSILTFRNQLLVFTEVKTSIIDCVRKLPLCKRRIQLNQTRQISKIYLIEIWNT